MENRIEKIAQFPTPKNKTGVRAFLKTIEIIKKWVSNFFEISRSLTRLTRKIEWKWIESEVLSFEILKVKCATTSFMFEYDYSLSAHFYEDASKFVCELIITQFQFQTKEKKVVEVLILYDSIIFTKFETHYSIYKRELCALTKFVMKYDHFCKYPKLTVIVHTDHKPLIQFLRSNCHEGIYDHWADKLRRLNLKIQYISRRQNRVANELFRTLFSIENCTVNPNITKAWKSFSKKSPK